MASSKLRQVTKDLWWSILLTGILSIIFGILTIVWPQLTQDVLVVMFALLMFVIGVVAFVKSFASIDTDPLWWLSLLISIVLIGGGIYLFCNPGMAFAAFIIFLGVFVIIQGLTDLIVASYTKQQGGRWVWILTGVLSLIFGVLVFFYPVSSALAFVWVLGLYALIRGIMEVAFAAQIYGKVKKITGKKKK